jgi:hypothetical protein
MQDYWVNTKKTKRKGFGVGVIYIWMENSTKQIKGDAGTRILVFIHARRRRGSRVRPSCHESKQHIMVVSTELNVGSKMWS